MSRTESIKLESVAILELLRDMISARYAQYAAGNARDAVARSTDDARRELQLAAQKRECRWGSN